MSVFHARFYARFLGTIGGMHIGVSPDVNLYGVKILNSKGAGSAIGKWCMYMCIRIHMCTRIFICMCACLFVYTLYKSLMSYTIYTSKHYIHTISCRYREGPRFRVQICQSQSPPSSGVHESGRAVR